MDAYLFQHMPEVYAALGRHAGLRLPNRNPFLGTVGDKRNCFPGATAVNYPT